MSQEPSSTPSPGDVIRATLDGLEYYLQVVPRSDRSAYMTWASRWRHDVDQHPGALRPLLDTSLLPSLVTLRYPTSTGALFFLPVLFAWTLLGIVELRYANSGSHESFFVWWTAQGTTGPFAYSLGIAGLLLLALLVHLRRARTSAFSASVEARVTADAATLAAAVGQLLDGAEAPDERDQAAWALTVAADRLSQVAQSLQLDRDAIRDYASSADRASASIAALEEISTELGRSAQHLTESLDGLPDAFAGIEARIAPVRDVVAELAAQSTDLKQRNDEIAGHLDRLASTIMPLAAQTTEGAVASGPAVTAAATALAGAYQELAKQQRYSSELVDQATRLLSYVEEGSPSGTHGTWPPARDE